MGEAQNIAYSGFLFGIQFDNYSPSGKQWYSSNTYNCQYSSHTKCVIGLCKI